MSMLSKVFSSIKSYNLLILLVVAFLVLSALSVYLTMFEKEITVGQKYVRPSGRRTHYQIVDNEGNNYVLGDTMYLLEFNSADDYALIKEGETYKIYGYWFRFPMLSWFPRIYKYEKV